MRAQMSKVQSKTQIIILTTMLFGHFCFASNKSEPRTTASAVHTVSILDANLIPRFVLSPVLQVKLNIGTLCLVGGEYGHGMNSRVFNNPPGCDNLHCAGPLGPISAWTKYFTIKSIIKCISLLLEKDESCCENLAIEEFNDRFNLDKAQHVFGSGPEENTRLISSLKVIDPKRRLEETLSKEEDIRLEIANKDKNLKHKIFIISAENLFPKPITYCLIARNTKTQDEALAALREENLECVACLGNRDEPQEPWMWPDQDVQTSTMACASELYSKHGFNLQLKNIESPTGFIEIRLLYAKTEKKLNGQEEKGSKHDFTDQIKFTREEL